MGAFASTPGDADSAKPGLPCLCSHRTGGNDGEGEEREPEHWTYFEHKMRKEGMSDAAIEAFRRSYAKLASGAELTIPEHKLWPVRSLPQYAALAAEEPELLGVTVVLKLNGGLGTAMGLEKAKSLLTVKGSHTFLDFIAKQARREARTPSPQRSRPRSLFPLSACDAARTRAHGHGRCSTCARR